MPIENAGLEIRSLDPARHEHAGFDCGHTRLNNFIKLNAKKQQKDDMSRVYVATYEGDTRVLGYSAINVGRINADELAKRPRGTPSHGEIPVLFLGQIAVTKTEAGSGIGGVLMYHVFEKAIGIAGLAGCYAIILDVVSDDGEAAFERRKTWYGEFGFISFPSDAKRMVMPISNARALVEAAHTLALAE